MPKMTKQAFMEEWAMAEPDSEKAWNQHQAVTDALKVLREIKRHHIALNDRHGRPLSHSHTLSMARQAIALLEGKPETAGRIRKARPA